MSAQPKDPVLTQSTRITVGAVVAIAGLILTGAGWVNSAREKDMLRLQEQNRALSDQLTGLDRNLERLSVQVERNARVAQHTVVLVCG